MDITWITDRLAVGGGIWIESKMIEAVRLGITHIIDMQIEFDDTPLAEPYGVKVLWNATEDDFQPKSPELLKRGVDFALAALDHPETRVFVHCAAGVHRASLPPGSPVGPLKSPRRRRCEASRCRHIAFSEATLIAIADRYQQATDWHKKRPALVAISASL